MIHIVFNESEVDLMKQVIELDETLAGEVIQIRDDYAVGPLTGLDTPEGWQARTDWWMELIKHSHYSKNQSLKKIRKSNYGFGWDRISMMCAAIIE